MERQKSSKWMYDRCRSFVTFRQMRKNWKTKILWKKRVFFRRILSVELNEGDLLWHCVDEYSWEQRREGGDWFGRTLIFSSSSRSKMAYICFERCMRFDGFANACSFWRDRDLFCVKEVSNGGVESLQRKVWVRIVRSTLWALKIGGGAPGS